MPTLDEYLTGKFLANQDTSEVFSYGGMVSCREGEFRHILQSTKDHGIILLPSGVIIDDYLIFDSASHAAAWATGHED